MDNKEEVLNEFLKGLRIVINNASAYPKEHPYFIKSVNIFKKKVETLFNFLSPIKINIAPDTLLIDGKYLEKAMLYVDLAAMFHLRKIKSVEFKEGLNNEELIDFLSCVSLPTKEVLRKGGIQNILNKEKSPHIYVEELDYSELLRYKGEETKDIWVYLFKAAIQKQDSVKINSFAENFEKIIGKFKVKDLYEDSELQQNIYNFLTYLKGTAEDKFYTCTRDLLRLLLSDKDISLEQKFVKMRAFFKDITNEDLTDMLLNTISKDDDFNNLSFAVFSRLVDEDRHKEIAPTLERKLKNAEFLKNNPKIRKKVKEIFSVSDDSYILPLYRQAIFWLSEDNISENGASFEREPLHINYRFILLNLLAKESDIQNLDLIAMHLLKECEKINQEKDLWHLKLILEVLDKKMSEDPNLMMPLEKLQECISTIVENSVFEDELFIGIGNFIGLLKKSYLGFNFYLNKIFNEGRVNPNALKLLLKFFPDKLTLFYEQLDKRKSDIDFLAKIIKGFEEIDSPLSLEVLKRVFYFSNNLIRMEILKLMQSFSNYDVEFLFSILKERDIFLKKLVLLILSRDEKIKHTALEELLSIRSPFGKKNKVIMENIMVVEATVGIELKDVREYLTLLSKRRFFWNRDLRKKAIEVLGRRYVRKN